MLQMPDGTMSFTNKAALVISQIVAFGLKCHKKKNPIKLFDQRKKAKLYSTFYISISETILILLELTCGCSVWAEPVLTLL